MSVIDAPFTFEEQLQALVFVTDSIRHYKLDNIRSSSSATHRHHAVSNDRTLYSRFEISSLVFLLLFITKIFYV